MNIEMYLSTSLSQGNSVATMSTSEQQSYEQILTAIQAFINDQELSSQAYDSAKSLYSAVLVPLVRAGILLSEAVSEACQKFPADYIANVDSGDLKSMELEQQIEELKQSIEGLQAIRNTINSSDTPDSLKDSQLMRNAMTMERYHAAKILLEEKLQKLKDFHAASPALFATISELESVVQQGANQANTSWNVNTGTFTIPSANQLSWTQSISEQWVDRDKRIKGIDDALVEELKEYEIYARVYFDTDGNPKVFWNLEKDGRGITDKRLRAYLDKAGKYLNPEMFDFLTHQEWIEKVNHGLRNGYDYTTGKDYNPFISGVSKTSMVVEDTYNWLTESELVAALSTLGFAYASYKLISASGTKELQGGDKTVNRIDELEIQFNRKDNHNSAEFTRQLENQQKGMNNLTVTEYLGNRQYYTSKGRNTASSAYQKTARQEALATKTLELRKQGLSKSEAVIQAETWMDSQAALHNPDMVAGGHPENIQGVGDSNINSSLGIQWRYRVNALDQHVQKSITGLSPEQLKNLYLNVKLTE